MNTPMQIFELTNGEKIEVPMVTQSGESFEWLGQCSYAELEMEAEGDDNSYVRCLSTRANETARRVYELWQGAITWEQFCDI